MTKELKQYQQIFIIGTIFIMKKPLAKVQENIRVIT